jgi:hypothetical protein
MRALDERDYWSTVLALLCAAAAFAMMGCIHNPPGPPATPSPTVAPTATPSSTPTPEPTPRQFPFVVASYGGDFARWETVPNMFPVEVQPLGYNGDVGSSWDCRTREGQKLREQLDCMPPYIQQAVDHGAYVVPLFTICAGCDADTHWFGATTAQKTCVWIDSERGGHGYCRSSVPSLKGFVVEGEEVIDPTMNMQFDPWGPYWKEHVPFVLFGDELGDTKAKAQARIDDYRVQEKARGLEPKLLAMTFTGDQIRSLDGHLAPGLNAVVLELYGAWCGDGDLEGDMDSQIARVPLDKKLIFWRPTYDHNGECAGKGPQLANIALRSARYVKKIMERWPGRVLAVLDFTYVRMTCLNGWCGGGARDYLQWFRDILTCTSVWLLGGANTCTAVPEPTPVPTPEPSAPGIVGWVENNKGAAREGDPITLYLYRTGAGAHAGTCTVAYTVESARGTGITPASGVATLDGPDAVYPITLTRPADPLPTGYAIALVRLGAATGCTPERGPGHGIWPDDQKVITWMTTTAVPGSGLTLVRFGPTDEPVRVETDCWGVVVFERGVATLFRNTPEPMKCTITAAPAPYVVVDPTAVVR